MPAAIDDDARRSPVVSAGVDALTAVRGAAALWVFVFHAWLASGAVPLRARIGGIELDLSPLASTGWAGVDVFYVLSGFLLWRTFDDWAGHRTTTLALRRYATRRALRILPPYYAQLALLVILAHATSLLPAPSWADLALHVTLMHGWSWVSWQSINAMWWTLSIEAQFYFVLPALAWIVRSSGWMAVMIAGLCVMLAWRHGAIEALAGEPIQRKVWGVEQLPARIDQFLVGMFASHLAYGQWGWGARVRAFVAARPVLLHMLLAAAPLGLVALGFRLHIGAMAERYWTGNAWFYAWHLLAGIAVALTLFALALRSQAASGIPGPAGARPWHLRALMHLGIVSYSFYLWHEILLRWLGPLIRRFDEGGKATLVTFLVASILGFVVARAVAMLSFVLTEQPFLRRREQVRDAGRAVDT